MILAHEYYNMNDVIPHDIIDFINALVCDIKSWLGVPAKNLSATGKFR